MMKKDAPDSVPNLPQKDSPQADVSAVILPKVALIGRPNVGKSTLFNRLVGQRRAIVHARPGVTRDRLEAVSRVLGGDVVITDTAGLGEEVDPLSPLGRAQTLAAMAEAAMVLLVIDGRLGVTPADEGVARLVRKQNKPMALLVNKAEGQLNPNLDAGLAKLGFAEPLLVSAEHGQGFHQLTQLVREMLKLPNLQTAAAAALQAEAFEQDEEAVAPPEMVRPLKLAIVGRPNVGKSTLVNTLLGKERLSVSPIAGTTRDAVTLSWAWFDKKADIYRPIDLVDTAGLRRKTKVEDVVEYMSVGATLNAIAMAEVVILLIDATQGLDRQDLQIARHVAEEGRVLVIAANKWDLVEDPKAVREELEYRLDSSFAQLRLPLITISAATSKNFDPLLRLVFQLYDSWNQRLPTPALNRRLRAAVARQSPPYVDGKPLKLRYMTQQSTRPPQFLLFSNRNVEIPATYQRYLTNSLRTYFKLAPVVVRWQVRTGDNPYT